MPIVVRELIIRARLDEGSEEHSNLRPTGRSQGEETITTEKIVSLCVEKVMETLERKKER